MGLSCNANCGGTIQPQNSDMGKDVFIPELAPLDHHPLFTFHDNFSIHDTCIDPLFDPLPPTTTTLVYPSLFDDQSVLFSTTNLPEIFPGQNYLLLDSSSSHFEQQYCCPKRQKTGSYYDYLGGMFDATDSSNFLPMMNSSPGQVLLPGFPLDMVIPPLLDYQLPEVYDSGSSSDYVVHKESTTTTDNGTSCVAGNEKMKADLSPQSIAARVRRKKISEKTQELGKLIPGGHKMNTAEMFQAGSKYIKFLEAQLGVLQTMPSIQENEGALEFIDLLTSPLVQEKIYMAEKCLVPRKMIESSLRNDHQLQSNPKLFKEIKQLKNKCFLS